MGRRPSPWRQEVRAKLEAGGDWTKLAAEYSDDPSTPDTGGDLGDVSKGTMVQEFEDSVFSLKLDEISQPVKTTYGYHVIQVTAINAAKQYPLEEVKDDITSNLLMTKKSDAWTKWVDDTKAEIGVVYQKGMEPTTTTTGSSTTDVDRHRSTAARANHHHGVPERHDHDGGGRHHRPRRPGRTATTSSAKGREDTTTTCLKP